MKILKTTCFILISFLVVNCAPKRHVQRIETDQTIDLSGRWNDSDSRIVSEELIKQLLSDNWMNNHNSQNPGNRPILIVGMIKNKSHEHIDANTYVFVSKNDETTYIKNARNLKNHIKNLTHYIELDHLSHKDLLWDDSVVDKINGVITGE